MSDYWGRLRRSERRALFVMSGGGALAVCGVWAATGSLVLGIAALGFCGFLIGVARLATL